MKDITNRRSFKSLVIIAAALLIMAIVGYYFYNSQQETNQQSNEQLTQVNHAGRIPDDFILRTDREAGVSFAHPEDWTEKIVTVKDEQLLEGLVSPDLKTVDGEYYIPEVGYWLEYRVTPNDLNESINEEYLANAQAAKEAHGGDYRTIQIDGHDAIISTTRTHGSYIWANTFANGNSYYFQLNAPSVDDPETTKLFEEILATGDTL